MILAIDVGGTNTRVALLEPESAGPRLVVFEKYASRRHASLEEIIRVFLEQHPARVTVACVGIAGPVKDERAVVTNLPWGVDGRDLSRLLGLSSVGLLNDIQANAWGIAALSGSDFADVNAGRPIATGTAAVIAAGTGLGQAGLAWTGNGHMPIASEGGHADFAPRNRLEMELLTYLLAKLGGRVSYERVLSGPGLVNLYRFLRDTGRGEEPEWLAQRQAAGDPAAEIATAVEGCPLAHAAMELFVSIYGAAAGNLALHFMATAGVYIGGGIAPKIVRWLQSARFLEAFLDKGRLGPVLALMPVRIITNDKTALLGAARWAWRSRRGGKPWPAVIRPD